MNGARISATGLNSYAINADWDSKVTGSGVYDINGDMLADNSSGTADAGIDITMLDDSLFTGSTGINGAGAFINLTFNGANTLWNVTGDSALTDLTLGGSTIDYRSSPLLARVYANNLYASSGGGTGGGDGTLIMRAGIASADSTGLSPIADLLVVRGYAEGSYGVSVANVGDARTTGSEVVTLVAVEEGYNSTAEFILKEKVELGGWQYDMRTASYTDDGSTPVFADANSITSGGVITDPEFILWQLYSTGRASEAGSAAINNFAGSYLMAYADTQTLLQRMGDLRKSPYAQGLWFRIHGGKFESNAKSYVRGFDMDYGGVQIGYDRKRESKWDGDIYTGVMFGYSKGDLDYGHNGTGGVDSKTLGIYGTYIGQNGFYIDAILKYQWMENDFEVLDSQGTQVKGGDVDTGGLGFSVEVGQRIALGGTQKSGWYVEPQVQLSCQRQDGGYFHASNGLVIGVDGFNSLLGRIGMLVGYETEKANFYGKVSKVKEFDGDLTVRANGDTFGESFASSWWVYGLGLTSRLNDRNSLYFDIERTSGGSFRQPWRINAGWRMEF